MKNLILWVAAAALVGAGPAFACSPRFTPFSQVVDDGDLAFRGRAKVRMQQVPASSAEEADGVSVYKGEVKFTQIDCYAPPKGRLRCPRSLTVPFEVVEDGVNCSPWVLWHHPRPDRYFTLRRDGAGQWQLGGAWRRFGRR